LQIDCILVCGPLPREKPSGAAVLHPSGETRKRRGEAFASLHMRSPRPKGGEREESPCGAADPAPIWGAPGRYRAAFATVMGRPLSVNRRRNCGRALRMHVHRPTLRPWSGNRSPHG
jgi:hypothetical protein